MNLAEVIQLELSREKENGVSYLPGSYNWGYNWIYKRVFIAWFLGDSPRGLWNNPTPKEENWTRPIEQEDNQGEASGKSKKLVSQGNRKAAYGIIIVDRLKLVEDHDITWISHLSKN